jgi:hypothetical protein
MEMLIKGLLAILFAGATLGLINMTAKIFTVFWVTDPFLVITVIAGFASLFVAWIKIVFY